MFIARLFLKSSTYTHKIAINCPKWLGERLNKFSVWLSYKAANSALRADGIKMTIRPVKPLACCGCGRGKCASN